MKQCPNCSNKCADVSKVCVYCGYTFVKSGGTLTENRSDIPYTAPKTPRSISANENDIYAAGPGNTRVLTAEKPRPSSDSRFAENKGECSRQNSPDRTASNGNSYRSSTPSYFDSIAGSQMTEEEARRLLFGGSESTASNDGFGSASPVLDDKSVLVKNNSRVTLLFGAVFRILFIVFTCIALIMFSKHMSEIQEFAVGDYIVSPMVLPIVFAVLAISPMIKAVGQIASFCISRVYGSENETALTGSFSAVRIAEYLRIAMLAVILIAADVLAALSLDFATANALTYTCILAFNMLIIVGIVYSIVFAGMYGNFKRAADGSDSLEEPIYAIDIVNVIMLFVFIPLGAFSIFKYSIVDIYSLGNSFVAAVIAAYISGCLALFFKSLWISVFRSDINTMDTVSSSVKERRYGVIGF